MNRAPHLAAEIERARRALDAIVRWPDAVEAAAALDTVGVAWVRHHENVNAEAELLRAARTARISRPGDRHAR